MALDLWGSRLTSATGMLASAALAGTWLFKHRRSPIVKNWRPSNYPTEQYGQLAARAFGEGTHTTLLLHGLGATSDYWSFRYDALAAVGRVVAPDLLGFGDSLDMTRTSFKLEDHLDALDECLAKAAPKTESLTIVAHSMGTGLAMAYAGRSSVPVSRVICIGAPIFSARQSALEMIAGEGFMARLLLLNQTWAKRFCSLSCAHRTLAGFLAAAATPSFPVAISRKASLHSWAAYQDSLENLVLSFDWEAHLEALGETPLDLIWGSDDQIGDPRYTRLSLGELGLGRSASVRTISRRGHHLAITDADVVLDLATRSRS